MSATESISERWWGENGMNDEERGETQKELIRLGWLERRGEKKGAGRRKECFGCYGKEEIGRGAREENEMPPASP